MSASAASCMDHSDCSDSIETSSSESESLSTHSNTDWSALGEQDELTSSMHGLRVSSPPDVRNKSPLHDARNVSPLHDARRPITLEPRSKQVYRSDGSFKWHLRPGKFAVIAVDQNYVVGVLDTVWFKQEKSKKWHLEVMNSLERAGVTEVFCCGQYVHLKRAAGDLMNVILDLPTRHLLRYSCNICRSRECAVQKAYLYWRRLVKRMACNLEH